MSEKLPTIYLGRNGETAWSLSGQHTGLTNLPLTERGERNAQRLGERLREFIDAMVFTSPLQRAARTCELAGFGAVAEIDPDLVEWNYGEYEDRRTADILKERPDWQLFREGCPGRESPEEVFRRADRVMSQVRGTGETCWFFRAGILFECSLPAGSDSKRGLPGGTSCSAQRAWVRSAMSIIFPSRESDCGMTIAMRTHEF